MGGTYSYEYVHQFANHEGNFSDFAFVPIPEKRANILGSIRAQS